MFESTKPKSIYELPLYQNILLVIFIFFFGVGIFTIFPSHSVDWQNTFYPVSKILLHPYSVNTFVNPPWTTFFLYPIHYFSQDKSQAINASFNLIMIGLLVLKRKGNLLSLVLTLTSLPFILLLMNGSIEWIPALGFILQNGWGLPMVLAKPQSGILAVLSWFLSAKNKYRFFIPAILTIIVSFILWGIWPLELIANINFMKNSKLGLITANNSPWPWAIPVGLGLIVYILKYKPDNSEILGTLATFCLVPYFFPHSLIIPFALLSISYRRLSIFLWVIMWLYPILRNLDKVIQILGIS